MKTSVNSRLSIAACLLAAASLLAGCSGRDDELEEFIRQTRQEQPAGVQPLPEVKPQETFTYAVQHLRSPFLPGGSGSASAQGVRPDSNRRRETLERYSLDSMRMVGTLEMDGRNYGLVQTKDGLVHRVLPGNYIGQSDGRIVSITPSRISITEIVPDGLGGYMERPTAIALSE